MDGDGLWNVLFRSWSIRNNLEDRLRFIGEVLLSGMSSLQMPNAHCGEHCCFSQTFHLHVKCSVSAADAERCCICVPHQAVSMTVLIVLDHSWQPVLIYWQKKWKLSLRLTFELPWAAVDPVILLWHLLKPDSAVCAVPFKASTGRMASQSKSGRQRFWKQLAFCVFCSVASVCLQFYWVR